MTVKLRLGSSDLLSVAGVEYRPVNITKNEIILACLDQPGITRSLTHAEVMDLLKSPDTRYRQGHFDYADRKVRGSKAFDVISELPSKVQSEVLWRQAVCDACLDLEARSKLVRTDRSFEAIRSLLRVEVDRLDGSVRQERQASRAGAKLTVRKLPCSRTVFRWLRLYEQGGYDPLALLPAHRRKGNRNARWCHRTEAIVAGVIDAYATTQRPTKAQAVASKIVEFEQENLRRRAAGEAPLRIPSARTLLRRLANADPYHVYTKRYGVEAANRKYNLFETHVDATKPLERVEMDEFKIDVVSLLLTSGILECLPPERRDRLVKGRRWLYGAKDCATKCILAIRIAETPNAKDAVLTLRDVHRDKTNFARAVGCESAWDQCGAIVPSAQILPSRRIMRRRTYASGSSTLPPINSGW